MNNLPTAQSERADKRFKRFDSWFMRIPMLSHNDGNEKVNQKDSVLQYHREEFESGYVPTKRRWNSLSLMLFFIH